MSTKLENIHWIHLTCFSLIWHCIFNLVSQILCLKYELIIYKWFTVILCTIFFSVMVFWTLKAFHGELGDVIWIIFLLNNILFFPCDIWNVIWPCLLWPENWWLASSLSLKCNSSLYKWCLLMSSIVHTLYILHMHFLFVISSVLSHNKILVKTVLVL